MKEVITNRAKIFKARIGQEENAQAELLNLIYLTRTQPCCLRSDLYRGSFNLINRALEDSIFIMKESWQDSISLNDYEANSKNGGFNQLKKTLFEEETDYFEINAYNDITDKEYPYSIVSCIKVELDSKESEKATEEILMCIEQWKTLPGFLKCELYKSVAADSFYIEQTWEDTQAFNKSEIYKFKLSSSIKTDVHNMNMQSIPTEPIIKNAVLGDPGLIAGLRSLNKDFGELCVNASAVPWGKPLIDQKTKALIAISIDVVEQITGKPFENHISMAQKQGVTKEELEELMLFLTIYAGFNKAGVFYAELERIFGRG